MVTAMGLGAGLMVSLAAARLISGLLYGINVNDPATFLVVALVLAFVGTIACYFPARRATRVDPLVALRYE